MKTSFVLLLAAAALASGCSASAYPDPAASPDTSWDQKYCESAGGYWNRNAEVCEAPLMHR